MTSCFAMCQQYAVTLPASYRKTSYRKSVQRGAAPLLVILIVVVAALILYVAFSKGRIRVPGTSTKESAVQVAQQYQNPFDKSTQYTNPFSGYKNPFDNLQK